MSQEFWDVVIIGAGPAGLMAAIACAEGGLRTLALDGYRTAGAKLLISGGGRCNVAPLKATEKDYQSGEPRTVRNMLRAFPPERALAFFKELGVEMVLEERTKYFPKQQSAKAVLDALLRASRGAGVVIRQGQKVRSLSKEDEWFRIAGEGFEYRSRVVVIATGGLSYPGTGSDGSGYALAKSLGHSIVPTTPALTPLLTDDPAWRSLAGITLPVRISFMADGKRAAQSEGAMLFTHSGFSGPAVLDISGSWLRSHAEQKELFVNFLPARREEDVLSEFARVAASRSGRSWKRSLAGHLPERLAEVFLGKAGIDPGTRLDQFPKKDREALLRSLFKFPARVTGFQGYEKAEVTAGGVDLREVDPKTLESKLVAGLFFAGEVLDVDGRIGGFNFQWAWASGRVAGEAIVKRCCGGQARSASGR